MIGIVDSNNVSALMNLIPIEPSASFPPEVELELMPRRAATIYFVRLNLVGLGAEKCRT